MYLRYPECFYFASQNKRNLTCLFDTKVFVANPNKSQPILDILLKNQQKLLEFLPKFHTERTDDEQFNDEKLYLIKQVYLMTFFHLS